MIYTDEIINNPVKLSHYLIENRVENNIRACDMTAGNGNDSKFILDKKNPKILYAFDIQKLSQERCEKLIGQRDNFKFILDDHKNIEKYINECVDSILNQLTDACEVILVDDGSPDRSGVICDGYADRDSRVKVVHQKNGGLAAARNTGLDCARGEYIAFVDSDDYLDGQCVSKILNWITLGGADICFMRAMKVFPDGKQQLLDDEMNAAELKGSKESAIKYLSERSKYPGSPCTKLFRRALLERNHLRFPDDRRVSEDLGFVLQCILNADSYDALPIDYYYYRQTLSALRMICKSHY